MKLKYKVDIRAFADSNFNNIEIWKLDQTRKTKVSISMVPIWIWLNKNLLT